MINIKYKKHYESECENYDFYLAEDDYNAIYKLQYIGNFEDTIELSVIQLWQIEDKLNGKEFNFEEFCKNEIIEKSFDYETHFDSDHPSFFEDKDYKLSHEKLKENYNFIYTN